MRGPFASDVARRRQAPSSTTANWMQPYIQSIQSFTPLSLKPTFWLDASDLTTITESGGAVSQWSDKSGNAYHFTQATSASQPATGNRSVNGLNVIDFVRGRFLDGGDILDLGLNSYSCFGVLAFDDTANAGPLGKHIFGSNDGRYGWLKDAGLFIASYDPDATASGGVSVADSSTQFRLIHSVLERNGSSSFHRVNISGVITQKSFSDTNTSWDTSAPWRIGRYGTVTTYDFDGIIGEIIFFLRTITPPEIMALQMYLKSKWMLLP